MKRLFHSSITVLACLSVATACSTRAVTKRQSSPGAIASSVIVTAEELAGILHPGTLMEALERLRPAMLRSRGSTPMVSIDGAPPAELSLLRSIPVSSVSEVRLLRSPWTVGRAGVRPNGDVVIGDLIVVSTWRGAR